MLGHARPRIHPQELPELVQMREHRLPPYSNLSPKNVAGVGLGDEQL